MGKIKQGILGAFSGKVAGVVGSSWKGIAVMKSLPPSVANPKTSGQIEQRSRMTACTAFASSTLASVIKPLNDRFASRMSGFNAFTSRNIEHFAGGELSAHSELEISPRGNKAQLIDAVAAEAKLDKSEANCSVDWTSDAGEGKALASDECFIVVYNRSTEKSFGFKAPDTRASGGTSVDLPAGQFEPGDEVDAYVAFLRQDGTVVFETAHGTATMGTIP